MKKVNVFFTTICLILLPLNAFTQYVWQKQISSMNSNLISVSFVDDLNGWIVTEDGTILSTVDAGMNWDSIYHVEDVSPSKIFFSTTDLGWLTGQHRLLSDAAFIYRTTNGGVSWEPVFQGLQTYLHDIFFINDTLGWTAGSELLEGDTHSLIMHSTDGGDNWSIPFSARVQDELYAIHFRDENYGQACGHDGLFFYTNNGGLNEISGWGLSLDIPSYHKDLYGIYNAGLNNGCAVGEDGIILHTTDKWVGHLDRFSTSGDTLMAVSGLPDGTRFWAAGKNGAIVSIRYALYILMIDEETRVTSENLNDICAVDDSHIWAVGENGTILNYSDNQPPMAMNDEVLVHQDSAMMIHVLDNDNDPDGDELRVVSLEEGLHGSALIHFGTSTILYNPDDGYLGEDTLEYTITDDNGGSDAAFVYIRVTPWEVCDGIDNDLDGLIDEDDAIDARPWYIDRDGDGYGDSAVVRLACEQPLGYADNDWDCNDESSSVYPGAREYCDSLDNDCNGLVDDDPYDIITWFYDYDKDGFGNPDSSLQSCWQPAGFVLDNTDCNDADNSVNPDAIEICDGIDNNCNGKTDYPDAVGSEAFFMDDDGDGYGDRRIRTFSCSDELGGYVLDSTDCDDTDAYNNPGMSEYCDGRDNDCDGLSDEEEICGPCFSYPCDNIHQSVCDQTGDTVACLCEPGYIPDNYGNCVLANDVPDSRCYEYLHYYNNIRPVDFLFILDRSESMADENAELLENIGVFFETLGSRDFHAAAVVAEDGCIVGTINCITRLTGMQYRILYFNEMADTSCSLSPCGDNAEAGFSLAEAALLKMTPGGCNRSFIRNEAILHLVFISDAPEQSMRDWASFVDFFRSMKLHPSSLRIHAIAGDYPGGCEESGPGMGYYQAAVSTGGLYYSICDVDWAAALEEMAMSARVQYTPLSYTADSVGMEVNVMYRFDDEDYKWRFNSKLNSIWFDPSGRRPYDGTPVIISYNCSAPCSLTDCGEHGSCATYNGEAICICDSGYTDFGNHICEPRICGNGICSWDEDNISCPEDCDDTHVSPSSQNLPSIRIYPNPVKEKLTINSESADLELVILSNLLGQQFLIKRINNNTITLDVSGFNTGVYLLQIKAAQTIVFSKLVIE